MFNSNENAIVEAFQFSATSQEMRSVLINGEPWVVAKDVCEILGIEKHRDAISRLDDDERGSVKLDTLGGMQTMSIINESGLYSLIFRSNKPEAKVFRKWVTSEVLPTIRKKGYYGIKSQPASDYLDMRDVPYYLQEFNGADVRYIDVDGEPWFSLNDIHKMIGSRTESSQAVRRLNAKRTLAQKIWIYRNTHPSWFVNLIGLQLLLSGSKIYSTNRQLALNF
ncbi:MAG: BRO family protein [Rikenellaceae bacterium]